MPQSDLEIRVENLEKTVADLAGLPQQMRELSTQFLQFRQEVRADVSGVRVEVGELRTQVGGLRGEVGELRGEVGGLRGEVSELRTEVGGLRDRVDGVRDELRGEMHGIHDELRADMASMHKDLAKAILDTRVLTLSLHEDLVDRIKLLGEGFKSAGHAPPSDAAR